MSQRRVVVVGAGSAGCVVAARLAERPGQHVTLLEAGPDVRSADEPAEIRGSSFVAAMSLPDRHWPGLMATRVRGQEPRLYRRGRGIGGSSAVNAMVALPGHRDDYDAWARDHRCAGWAATDVGPWLRQTQLVLTRASRAEWGAANLALADAVPAAAAGVALTRTAAGVRVSAADAYLEPMRGAAQLHVRGGAVVDRLLFEGRQVCGVRLADGHELEADLVVVCAGAIHSPAVLLRSGVDTPGVGDNLHDHPSFPIAILRREAADPSMLPIATVAQLASPDGVDDAIQLLPIDHVDPAAPGVSLLMAAIMRSHSRGSVRLADADASTDPVVAFDMLSDERDWAPMNAAIDAAERALDHPSFRALGDVAPYDRSPAGVRASLGDYVHAAGTCAMGTVVDTRGRLIGYEGVVVCDASIMPEAPRANTHLPTVMIAERIASWL
jgi:choline dehydrogenase-like flavoprotein